MNIFETNSVKETQSKTKQKTKADIAASPIRVRQSTRVKMDELLKRANKHKLGERLRQTI